MVLHPISTRLSFLSLLLIKFKSYFWAFWYESLCLNRLEFTIYILTNYNFNGFIQHTGPWNDCNYYALAAASVQCYIYCGHYIHLTVYLSSLPDFVLPWLPISICGKVLDFAICLIFRFQNQMVYCANVKENIFF